ncbi:MAG TPA: dienelactone hydrolase family protein [Steroidobacteraceae bacterium]|jgi:carboxymethylenebutenolidase
MRNKISKWSMWLTLFAVTPLLAATRPVTLSTAQMTSFVSYVGGPQTAAQCVVLVHDWFGVSPSYKDAAERLARRGYCVVAVDLYDGRSATTHEQAGALLGSLDAKLAGEKIDAAIKSLSDRPRKIAVMGFSMGARHALSASLRNKSVRATVLWYGDTTKDVDQLANLSGPVLLVVGSKDGTTLDDSAAFVKAADAAGAGAEVYVYPGAAHAFAQPLFNQGKTYDPVAAESSWRLTEDFLERRLH